MVKVMGTNTSSEDQFWLTVCGDDFGTFWSSFYKLNNRKRLANHPKQFADVVQPSGDSCHNNLSTRIRGDETPKKTNMEPTKLVVCTVDIFSFLQPGIFQLSSSFLKGSVLPGKLTYPLKNSI